MAAVPAGHAPGALSHLEIRSARLSPCTPFGPDELSPPAEGSSAGRRQTIHLLLVRPWKHRKQSLKSQLSSPDSPHPRNLLRVALGSIARGTGPVGERPRGYTSVHQNSGLFGEQARLADEPAPQPRRGGRSGLCSGAAGRCCSAPGSQSGRCASAARRGSARGPESPRRRVPARCSQIAFMRGAWTAVRRFLAPVPWKTASNEAVKFDPRSRSRNLMPSNRRSRVRARLRACCAVHSLAGLAVTPQRYIRRVPCSMNTRT